MFWVTTSSLSHSQGPDEHPSQKGEGGLALRKKKGRLLSQVKVDAGLISVKGTHPTDEETESLSRVTLTVSKRLMTCSAQ